MAIHPALKAAFTSLRKSFGRDKSKATVNEIHDAFNALHEDALPLPQLVEHTTRLAQVLSENIPLLHKARARSTLGFYSSAFAWLCKTRLECSVEASDKPSASLWEETALNGLILPLLDICCSEDKNIDMFGEIMYPAICRVMRSPIHSALGGRFARSLALMILETCSSSKNKHILLDDDVFGASALSKLIIDAKDYHHLDTLLELSFNTFSTQDGTHSRHAHATDLFNSEYAELHIPQRLRSELVHIHEITDQSNSEKHVMDIIRTMSLAQVDRPQVFSTQDLEYCGTVYTQRAPNNVAVMDNGSVSIIMCDEDDETDVLVASFASIKEVLFSAQNASRMLVDFTVSEAPLVYSIREEVTSPATHKAGDPLRLRVSIALSDLLGFEAALAARNLASTIAGDVVSGRRVSLGNAKVSTAASKMGFSRQSQTNVSHETIEEMMKEYVNMTPAITPPVQVPERPIQKEPVLSPSSRPAESALNPTVIKRPRGRPPGVKKSKNLLPIQAAPSVKRPRRACAVQASKEIQNALEQLDDSDVSEPESHRGASEEIPSANDALPTPPDTRRTKPPMKTFAPTLSVITKRQVEPSSPIYEVTSPTAKILSKRKRVEEDPIEALPDIQERPDLKVPKKSLPSSQYTAPRNTAATRATAKYTANAKKMRIELPDPILDNVDEVDSPIQADVDTPMESRGEPDCSDGPASSVESLLYKNGAAAFQSNHTEAFSGPPQTDDTIDDAAGKSTHGAQPSVVAPSMLKETHKNRAGRIEITKKTEGANRETTASTETNALNGIVPPTHLREQSPDQALEYNGESVSKEAVCSSHGEKLVQDETPSSQADELLAALARVAKKASRASDLEPKPTQPSVARSIEEKTTCSSDQKQNDRRAHVETENAEAGVLKPTVCQTRATSQGACSERKTQGISAAPLIKKEKHAALTLKHSRISGTLDGQDTKRIDLHLAKPAAKQVGDQIFEEPSLVDNRLGRGSAEVLSEKVPLGDLHPSSDLDLDSLEPPTSGRLMDSKPAKDNERWPRAVEVTPKVLSNRRTSVIAIDLSDAESEQNDPAEIHQPPVTKLVFQTVAKETALAPGPTSARLWPRPEVLPQTSIKPNPTRSALERLLISPHQGPKSALVTPQKRPIPGRTRPSVSFAETFAPDELETQQNDRWNRVLDGTSTRAGNVMIQIVRVLDEIQTTIAENLSEKVQIVTADARNARTEVTRAITTKFEMSRVKAKQHYGIFHEFEGIFAKQTQVLLDGFKRVDNYGTRMNSEIQGITVENARAGQLAVKTIEDFEIPDTISAYMISPWSG